MGARIVTMLRSVVMAIRQHLRRHILVIGLLIIVAGLIAASDNLHEKAEEIVLWTEGMISQAPLVGMLVFVLLAMLSAMVAFFSSALLAPIAVNAWGPAGCLVLLWSGWFLGGIVSYGIGRFFGRAGVVLLIGEEKIASWESLVSRHTRFLHVLLFQATVPSEVPGYLLGILRYRFLFYMTALGLTEIPYAVATVYLGESFLQGESVVFIVVGIGMLVLAAIVVQARRHMIKTREDSDLT